jgi:hypothetical protein
MYSFALVSNVAFAGMAYWIGEWIVKEIHNARGSPAQKQTVNVDNNDGLMEMHNAMSGHPVYVVDDDDEHDARVQLGAAILDEDDDRIEMDVGDDL